VRLLTGEGVALVLGVTLCGAALSRTSRLPLAWLSPAAAVLFAVLVLDIVPDVRAGLAVAGLPWWIGVAAALLGFLAISVGPRGGTAAGLAIAAHRLVEGATLAIVISPAAILAFGVHALAEGFALGVRLHGAPHRTVWGWLGVAGLSPAVGAMLSSALPDRLQPVLMAAAAGAVARVCIATARGDGPRPAAAGKLGRAGD
jgi:zinc transporter ZupT